MVLRNSLAVLLVLLLLPAAHGQEEEDDSPWNGNGPWYAEQSYGDGVFEDEPPDRVRLLLERSTNLQNWERVQILDAWMDDGTIIQEADADRQFWRLYILSMNHQELLTEALSADVDGNTISVGMDVRTRDWQVLTSFVKNFLEVPVPWDSDPRVEEHMIPSADATTAAAMEEIIKKLETGAFRKGDKITIHRNMTDANPDHAHYDSRDIGPVALPGSTVLRDNDILMAASGHDIWGDRDGFHYYYRPLSENDIVQVRVVNQTGSHENAKAGIMVREDLTPDSRHVMVSTHPNNTTHLLYRDPAGAETIAEVVDGTPPIYLKVERVNTTIHGYVSQDGIDWDRFGFYTLEGLPETAYVGLAVTSHDNEELNEVTFDQFVTKHYSRRPGASTE